jgi:hypothetical protein
MECEHSAGATPRDAFVLDVERVAAAGRKVFDAIAAAICALEVGRDARLEGRPLVDVVEKLIGAGGRTARLDASEAFFEYQRALSAMRAGVVRTLVDDAGLSLTEVAAKMQISRQSAAKLYRAVQ